jgi:hypothetical protein
MKERVFQKKWREKRKACSGRILDRHTELVNLVAKACFLFGYSPKEREIICFDNIWLWEKNRSQQLENAQESKIIQGSAGKLGERDLKLILVI